MMIALYISTIIWLAVGIGVTIATKDPEQDGWLWMILLWPLQLWAQFY